MTGVISPEVHVLLGPEVDRLKRGQLTDPKEMALAIAHLLMRVILTRWINPKDLIAVIRAVGVELEKAQPKNVIPGNIVRRVLALIRDEIEPDTADTMMSLMFNLLSTESIKQETNEKVIGLKRLASDLRLIIIQGIRDLVDEITNVHEGMEIMAADLIHDNEVLLTPTATDTVLQFLIKARTKRKFSVLVTENYPNNIHNVHKFVKELAGNNIETTLIPDHSVYAVMSRVGKVIMNANAVFANGGCISDSGVANVAECAKEFRTPVLAISGLYKLSPRYPFNSNSMIQVGNSGKVLDYSNSKLLDNVQVVTNPLTDYIPPENIDILMTNIGGFAPSFIYRIVLDNYKTEDNHLE
ncbi:GCD complex subunit gcd7 [Scheffersomyces spartinae]|uniref:Translation initiation factor eIF2B subunit beta n=1 Tax=Scheffersomyces spartinae TaxID=45513 RepID=A0A9P7V9M4_9ASCO|nr:GCD complex subunit gcd7 [Scheffersomyces spartinae]KAG7193913.1 GCD complex subunit gcd7 [Scheffersomyces spartinae]